MAKNGNPKLITRHFASSKENLERIFGSVNCIGVTLNLHSFQVRSIPFMQVSWRPLGSGGPRVRRVWNSWSRSHSLISQGAAKSCLWSWIRFRIFLLSLWLVPLDFDLLAVRRISRVVTSIFASITKNIYTVNLNQNILEIKTIGAGRDMGMML